MVLPGDKINNEYQNPIDIGLLYFCRAVDQPLHAMGVTPNMITLFGLIIGIMSIYFLIHKHYLIAVLLLWFTYFTDCLDGYMARKYNQTSKLGDYLDHFRDQFVILCIVILMTLHIKEFKYRLLFVFVITISAILMLSQLGCQEKLAEYNDHNECLGFLKKLCPGNAEENIKLTRWCGCGTFYLILSIFIVALRYQI
uniref:CDP-alcohol phosphatidyltransferase n=1 Tax=viral metagenome TaxID=1070528 RepID=A0A6C0KSL6_9ZZZZ